MAHGIRSVELEACVASYQEVERHLREFHGPGVLLTTPEVLWSRAPIDSSNVHLLLMLRSREPGYLVSAIRLGARGFAFEDTVTQEQLERILIESSRGDVSLPPDVAAEIVRVAGESRFRGAPTLTGREAQVLDLIVEGLTNRQVGVRLGISEHGAKKHVANVLAKLNCQNRALAAARAVREGLVVSFKDREVMSD